jgi:hypothetical protein
MKEIIFDNQAGGWAQSWIFVFYKNWNFLAAWTHVSLSRRILLHGVHIALFGGPRLLQGKRIRRGNRFFEDVTKLKYLGTALTDQSFMNEDIKSRRNSENACYHSVQSLLSSRLLSRNVKVKTYKTTILPVVLYGCETWSVTLRKGHRMRCLRTGL